MVGPKTTAEKRAYEARKLERALQAGEQFWGPAESNSALDTSSQFVPLDPYQSQSETENKDWFVQEQGLAEQATENTDWSGVPPELLRNFIEKGYINKEEGDRLLKAAQPKSFRNSRAHPHISAEEGLYPKSRARGLDNKPKRVILLPYTKAEADEYKSLVLLPGLDTEPKQFRNSSPSPYIKAEEDEHQRPSLLPVLDNGLEQSRNSRVYPSIKAEEDFYPEYPVLGLDAPKSKYKPKSGDKGKQVYSKRTGRWHTNDYRVHRDYRVEQRKRREQDSLSGVRDSRVTKSVKRSRWDHRSSREDQRDYIKREESPYYTERRDRTEYTKRENQTDHIKHEDESDESERNWRRLPPAAQAQLSQSNVQYGIKQEDGIPDYMDPVFTQPEHCRRPSSWESCVADNGSNDSSSVERGEVGEEVVTLKRTFGVDGPGDAVDEAIAKKVKIQHSEDAGVDIIDTPDRSRNIVQSVLATKRDLLEDEDDSESDDDEFELNINKEYVERFEHNKKRKERDQLEAKYGSASSSESESQSEDEEGEFATEAIDAEITATLRAIRDRDPRVFDKVTKFYTEADETATDTRPKAKDKPMYLQDYHRKNLLEGANDEADELEQTPARKSYAQEQAELKRDLVKSMHSVAEDDNEDEDSFLKPTKAPSPAPERPPIPNVETADKDPENFLSNYFASRAWVPLSTSRFAHLESDDDEEDQRAEEFEELYNTRFEDPDEMNRTIMTYSRSVVKDKSVRREKKTGRQLARDREKERKEEDKKERQEERNRLKKLKMEEMEDKVTRIKEASGVSGKNFKMEEWADVLEADFDDDQWDGMMRMRFGDAYYAEEQDEGDAKGKKAPKKPKWDDDIDIKDLVPDFDDEDAPNSNLLNSEDEAGPAAKKPKSAKAARAEAKASQRRDRRILEAIADQAVDLPTDQKEAPTVPFRYREVSPGSFGLTTMDILAADDAELNQFVGLKKLGSFRDPSRKAKDKKKFGKKYRLKMWRREVFGRDDEPADHVTVDVKKGKMKKRSRGEKAQN